MERSEIFSEIYLGEILGKFFGCKEIVLMRGRGYVKLKQLIQTSV
jgi:hypothetical protein